MRKLLEKFQRFVDILKPMSWGQRIDHIFSYYKPALIGVLAVFVFISIAVNAIHRSMNPPLYRGALIGIPVTDSLNTYLTTDLQVYLDGSNSSRPVILKEIPFMDISNPQSMATNQAAYLQLTAMITGQDLEYALMDQHAWGLLKDGYFFADLTTIFPQEILSKLDPYIQRVQDPDSGALIPLGIDISHLSLSNTTPIYLAFSGNTGNESYNIEFLKYINNWE